MVPTDRRMSPAWKRCPQGQACTRLQTFWRHRLRYVRRTEDPLARCATPIVIPSCAQSAADAGYPPLRKGDRKPRPRRFRRPCDYARRRNPERHRSTSEQPGVNNQWCTETRRFLHDTRISLRPIIPIHRIEPHAVIADVNLQPIAIVLEFVHPARASGGLVGDGRPTRMNETGRRIDRPPERTTRHCADIAP